MYVGYYESPIGKLTYLIDDKGLVELIFGEQLGFCDGFTPFQLEVEDKVRRWLDLYFAGEIPDFVPPLHLRGSEFQLMVWRVLQTIPYGQTMSYGEIASAVAHGGVMSAQAVGTAVGCNPVPIIVPCHRVIGSNGGIGGYSDGLDRKLALLEIEGVAKIE